MALPLGVAAAWVGNHCGIGRWALPARTLAELIRQLVTTQYPAPRHPAISNNRREWRDMVLTELARCGRETEGIDPDELYDGTAIAW